MASNQGSILLESWAVWQSTQLLVAMSGWWLEYPAVGCPPGSTTQRVQRRPSKRGEEAG
jgi:hypothetical protein